MNKNHFLFSLLTVIILFTSCKKNDSCVGGSGGNLSVKVFLQHQSHPVINLKNYRDTVYVKYNTLDYPGSIGEFDATCIGEFGQDYVLVPNLRCGDYYFFGVGLEPVHFSRVSGGMPLNTEQRDGELSITIPVSE